MDIAGLALKVGRNTKMMIKGCRQMEKFGKSQPVKRVEDVRFLTGEGRYVDDIAPTDALHAYFFRSPVAHGVITTLDVTDAAEAEGVHAVLTIEDLEAAGMDISMAATVLQNRDGTEGAKPLRPMLAKGRVRFVGEPVAVVIAETLNQARDAAELIAFDVDDLPTHMTLERGGETLHPEAPDNMAFDWGMGDENRQSERGRQPYHRQRDGAARLLCGMERRQGASCEQRAGRLGAQGQPQARFRAG